VVPNADHGKTNVRSHSLCGVPFIQSNAGLTPGDAVECDNANLAILVARALAQRQEHYGALAFSRTTDTEAGHFSDAVVLKKFGKVPSDTTMLY
jgi:hypothetical protein